MIKYPDELFNKYFFIKIVNSETYAIYLTSVDNIQVSNVTQKSHCLEIVLEGKIQVSSGGAIRYINAGEMQFRKRGNYQLLPGDNYSAIQFYIENEFIVDFLKQ